jgi:hypothetical protein
MKLQVGSDARHPRQGMRWLRFDTWITLVTRLKTESLVLGALRPGDSLSPRQAVAMGRAHAL